MRRLATAALILGLAAGCSSQSATTTSQHDTGSTTPATRRTETPQALDASAVIHRLANAHLGLTRVAVQDENTDPNRLLGRPGGYTSRASADLPGGDSSARQFSVDRGLVVEVFPDSAGAERRSAFIQSSLQGNPALGTEWHYFCSGGRALVRVSGNAKPSLAKRIEKAASGMG